MKEVWLATFEVIYNFYTGLPRISSGCKSNEKICHIEYQSTKCRSDLQTYKHNILQNLGLQISGISRQQTLLMLTSIGAHHSHLHQICCLFYHPHHLWLHHYFWPDHSQNSYHKQLNLLFFGSKESGCKLNFLKSVILSTSDSVPDEDRFCGGNFAKSDDKKNELDYLAYT